jgi:predicted NUDIX family NTP pyrophosphohydrolase
MPKRSAGLLMFRRREGSPEVLLVHPGGPLWKRKDLGAWSIPKGQYTGEEPPLEAAQREFKEETGIEPAGDFLPLGEIRQPSGKLVMVWAFEGDADPSEMRSNTFTMAWPPGSSKMREFPEIDRAEWFPIEAARRKILPGQAAFLDELVLRLHR